MQDVVVHYEDVKRLFHALGRGRYLDYIIIVLARLKPNLAPLGARFIPYKTLVYLNVWEIKVE